MQKNHKASAVIKRMVPRLFHGSSPQSPLINHPYIFLCIYLHLILNITLLYIFAFDFFTYFNLSCGIPFAGTIFSTSTGIQSIAVFIIGIIIYILF